MYASRFRRIVLPAVVTSTLVAVLGCSRDPNGSVPRSADEGEGDSQSLDRSALTQQGKAAVEAGDYDRAIVLLTNAVAGSSTTAIDHGDAKGVGEAFYQRGVAYALKGFPDTAIADFSAVLRCSPEHAEALCRRGEAYLAMSDVYKALQDCTHSIRFAPHNPHAYLTRGEAYLRRNLHERAIADLQEAFRQDEERALPISHSLGKAYFLYSQRLRETNRLEEADNALAKAKEYAKDVVTTQEAAARAAARRESDVVEPSVSHVGGGAPALGPETPAEVHAKPIVDDADLKRMEAERYLRQAQSLRRAGDLAGAINALAAAAALQPQRADLYVERADAWLGLGFPDTALLDAQQAIRLDGGAPTYRREAEAFLGKKSYHRAIDSASEAIRRGPLEGSIFGVRGKAYLGRDMLAEAVRDFEYALRLEPSQESELKPLLADAQRRLDQRRRQEENGGKTALKVQEASRLGRTTSSE